MRNLNECQAEVFRRSEKRIKERKQRRNQILMACIPVVLCVSLLWTVILPAMLPADDKNTSAGEGMDMVSCIDGSDAAFIRLEVVSTGTAAQALILKDDVDEVAQIYDTVQSSFASAGGCHEESASEGSSDDAITEVNKEHSQNGTTTMVSGYRIIFTTDNGTQEICSLVGDKLINETTNQEAILTADQRSNLMSMLGLTITWEDPQ